ncbi:kinesin-like protein KIN-12D [Spinacia oleracea]|uniref:Kinesin-like protein KIN-12D n=1 Tax=Spinacia oleracea TaxID=3562 RepID=A0A9R0JY14_SPIOL|nr:kinesin-like protein KIN-12D [Spinacia oleracea]
MLRDFKLSRRNPEKNEEIENVPINPNDPSSNLSNLDSSRAPLVSLDHEVSVKSKFERTPIKSKLKTTELLRTPERQGFGTLGRRRFGFSGVNDDGRSEMSSYLGQSGRNGGSLNLTPRVSGATTTGRNNSGCNERISAQTTPTKSVSKPPNPGYAPLSSQRYPGNSSARVGNYATLSRGFSVSGAQHCVVNSVEVPHFDLKEDPSFWMDHNVQVILRARPLNGVERNTQGFNRCVRQDGPQSITWIGQPETRFTFDHVACETVDQEMLFRMAGLPMVENCLSGYNSCMFAYGQTGSGKTYTMLGEMDGIEFTPSPHRGMTPRIFEFLFARIRAEEESRSDEKLKYNCRCSFLEIYNEQITDLLDPSSTNLLLREDVNNGVYVENLSEFEVHTVGDILRLLIQGSSNRKVAATNMNRESSRSHSVFTCIIESKWERDSTTNLRFARLNLVDLAGSERQKSSGAEGERLKEAANINKSLSTLGHVIMLLVDIAHGKPRHVPYRDSRLTFLLQDSLGGNSKTMIIANISPSICCAAETLNTLKFAQRAKLIQNNAVVNEDSSGDIAMLHHQISVLKEELSTLKRQSLSRALAFDPCTVGGQENPDTENRKENEQPKDDDLLGCESKGNLQMSSKQLKSMELMLAGAMRREQMSESSIKKLEAEIEQLNRLVRQREEEARCSKMMLKFREDKIQRLESLVGDLKPVDAYLLEENVKLSEENKLLRAKVDRNPEVTRFAVENIRLLEQLRRFQDFYEEGERDMLLQEISELRTQLIRSLDNSSQQHKHADMVQDAPNNSKENEELNCTLNELAECQSKLKSCIATNAKLSREIEDLQAHLRNKESRIHDEIVIPDSMKEMQAPCLGAQLVDAVDENSRSNSRDQARHAEEIVNLELELDILKIILKEERVLRGKVEETAFSLTRDVQLAEEKLLLMRKQWEGAKEDLNEAKSVIEALESQQLLSISEIEDYKICNSHYLELLHQQELQIAAPTEQKHDQESTLSCIKHSEGEDSPLQLQLKRMQASLDKAKRLNMWYQSDHASQRSNEEEMDEVRRQVEAETAEVIVCLQEELSVLQQRVQESDLREKEAESRLHTFDIKLKELQETSDMLSHENETLHQSLLEKNTEMQSLVDDWELLSCEIEESLIEGHDALRSASDQLSSDSLSDRRGWVSEQFGKMIRQISDKESIIEQLNQCLEDANSRANDMERMLMSLRGAAMVMTESHQQECYEKENEIQQLNAELYALLSANKGCESKEIMEAGVLSLQAAFIDFGEKCESKILALDHKLQKIEGCAQDAKISWHQSKELLELQLVDAESITAQNTVETSCLLARFEEAQDTMKEADIMINELMIANETVKIQVEDLRTTNVMLTSERDGLIIEVQRLQSANEMNDQTCRNLEKQLEMDVSQNLCLIEELERIVSQVQDTSEEAFISLTHELNCTKAQLLDTVKVMHSSLEDIWSQIFMKDCALSVLHLCHMGVLLEAVTSLNAENGLLHHGISESDAVIYDLREHNMKSKEELEMCRMLKGKLLADFKSSFDRILRKEGETGELNLKLVHFKEKLLDLQHQEEMMLERSNFMSSELSSLMMELGQSNSQLIASVAEQEEFLTVECQAKDFELLIMASELQELADSCSTMQREQTNFQAASDFLIREIVTLQITADLREEIMIERETMAINMQKRVDKAVDGEAKVLTQLQTLVAENKLLGEQLSLKENGFANLQNWMFLLQASSQDLKNSLLVSESENESLQNKLLDLNSENCTLLNDIQTNDLKFKSFTGVIDSLKIENSSLLESISVLESRIAFLDKDLEGKKAELDDFQCLQSSTVEALCNRSQDLESYTIKANALQEENLVLRNEVQSLEQRIFEVLNCSSSKVVMSASSLETAELQSCRIHKQIEEKIMLILDQMSEDGCQNLNMVSRFLEELEFIDFIAKSLVSENLSMQEELLRKEEVLNGLQFDLRLLQESAANIKDQKDEIEELATILESTESELATRSHELDEAVAYGQALEAKVMKQGETASGLEMDLEKANQSVNMLSDDNSVLKSQVEDLMAARSSLESELSEKKSIIDDLENELLEMGHTLGRVNDLVESLKRNLNEVNTEKDQLQEELLNLEGKVETAHALAEENEAVAAEAREIAESRRLYAEEKEEEVQLLENSVQELDSTISVLENKLDVLKGEAERQRLQREELELELQSLKTQILNVENADADIKRHYDEKSRNLQEAIMRVQILEKDLKNKDTQIVKCKAHISELTLHAEAQACEYKRKFKELEAMVEQLKLEEVSNNKLEKNATKGRGSASPFKAKGSGSPFKPKGSGSPFKCIGLGYQLKCEKDEENNAERLRIEELEALAASKQKEIFMLNSRLASAESMTHDVIRDLLGVKLDMSSYMTLLDKQGVQKITEKAQLDSVEPQDQEVNKVKKQLNEFIEERQRWLEEIDRKQAEVVATQIALEKHRQQEQLLASENEEFKAEIHNHRKRVAELEGELKKLSGQQNIQQRIHHHAKIKEENNVLKVQNEDLHKKLKRYASQYTSLREDLADYRARNGKGPYTDFDEEQRLRDKIKETKQENLHLAQTLLALCTNILKAAGIQKPTSEVDLSAAAEEALEELVTRVISLEREVDDLRLKNRSTKERTRLTEHRTDPSTLSSRSGDNRQSQRRRSQSQFFSTIDR